MKEYIVDIAVVGGGSSGSAAAAQAAQLGAKVAVIHKDYVIGGCANVGMGLFAAESKLQKRMKVKMSKEQAFVQEMEHNHWKVDAQLMRAFIYKSAETIDWLMDMGIEFKSHVGTYFEGADFTQHEPLPVPREELRQPERFGVGWTSRIVDKLEDILRVHNAEILTNTTATELVKDGEKIVGIRARHKDGEEILVRCKAVILATGGFGQNPALVKELTGYELGKDIIVMSDEGTTGDGLKMAWDAGAARGVVTYSNMFCIPNGDKIIPLGHPAFNVPNLMVNKLGERFVNEELVVMPTDISNAISVQKDHEAFMIFDENAKKEFEENFDPASFAVPIPLDVGVIAEHTKGLTNRGFFAADSLEELAEMTGISLAGLKQTVENYNNICSTGNDVEFLKKPANLRPVAEGRFYAGKMKVAAFGTLGGVKINHKMEAIDENFNLIPGLYAVGNDSNALYRDSYNFYMPSTAMGYAFNSGRIAAENAVQYVKL